MIVIFDFSISPIGHNATHPIFISDFPQNARYPFELQRKKVAFSIAGKGNLLRFGFSPAPAPRTLHPGTSFARWTSSTVLCPLAAVHFALRSRQTLCPFENNLFHRTYLCRSRLAEAEGRSFFAERCRHPGGGFAPCSAGSARISLAHGRILSKLRFGFSAPPVFPCANRLCSLGSVPSLGFGGARFARLRFSILDVPFGLFPCSHPAALFPMGFASMRPLRPKLPPSWGSMQISDLWILRFETHFHFRILAGFGIALCRLRVLGPSRWLPVDGESVRTRFPPGSIVSWRLCAPVLCFCLCPPKFCASRFGKSRSMEKEFPSCFVWFFRVLRRVSAGTAPEAAIFPLCLCRSIVGFFRSSGCCVLRVFRASAPALPPIPASPEEFRFQGFLLIGRAASLALLLGLPPAVFSPSDDFFELPLSRSLMQPLCCIRIKHTLSRLLRSQFPEAVGTLPLAISAFSPFAIGSAPFPFSCLYYSMPFAVCQQESFCVYLLCIYNYLRALPTSKFP